MKNIVVLGSTGSIGVSSLDVIANLGKNYKVLALAVNSNINKCLEQIQKHKPKYVAVYQKNPHDKIAPLLPEGVKLVGYGDDALAELATLQDADLIINGLVGAVGFKPLIEALKAGKTVALANKEPIVMAGKSIMRLAKEHGGQIVPVDSEPSAIFQSLEGKIKGDYETAAQKIRRVFLTASGGPFLNYKGDLSLVTPQQALKHPRWVMGPKITIDSSTLMNKGFEAIEIMNLFNLPLEKIEVIIHPQSIIHSAVEYVDSSVLAQLSLPDMRLPIQYAITYPDRLPSPVKPMDLFAIANLEIKKPDLGQFKCLNYAFECAVKGMCYPAALSAADEIAVAAFLDGKIKFTDIEKVIYEVINNNWQSGFNPSLEEATAADAKARAKAEEFIKKFGE